MRPKILIAALALPLVLAACGKAAPLKPAAGEALPVRDGERVGGGEPECEPL